MTAVVHKPLGHHRVISGCSFLLLFAAFVLFLLVALSIPIIKGVYILALKAKVSPNQPVTSIGTELRFGVWGVCVNSALDTPTFLNGGGECTSPALGYTIPTEYLNLLGLSPSLVSVLLKALEVLLVLHPVSAGLSLLTFVQALFLGNHGVSICALILSIITAIVSSVTLAADVALGIVAKNKLRDLTVVNFEVQFGNGVWMVVAAVVLTWITVMFLSARACYCLGVRSSWREPSLKEKNVPAVQYPAQAQAPYSQEPLTQEPYQQEHYQQEEYSSENRYPSEHRSSEYHYSQDLQQYPFHDSQYPGVVPHGEHQERYDH